MRRTHPGKPLLGRGLAEGGNGCRRKLLGRVRKCCTLAIAGLFLSACDKEPPPTAKPSEPWPAPAVSSATRRTNPGLLRHYQLAPEQKIEFELKTRKNLIAGQFPVLEGSLSVDLMNLKQAEAKVRIDVGATRITVGTDQEQIERSMLAQNWLNAGASIPEATREQLRWATFLLEEIQEVRHEALHDATLNQRAMKEAEAQAQAAASASATPEAGPPPNDDDLEPAVPAEIRSTRARILGSLQLNNRRVTDHHSVDLDFHYAVAATPGMPPERIVVQTPRPISIALSQHDIVPRNGAGVSIASDLKLIGPEVGKTAKVNFSLQFVQKGRPKGDPSDN